MNRATLSLALALLGPASLAAQLDGRWEGAIEIQGQELGIVVQFTTTDGILAATIDIPLQGAAGLPLDSVDHQHPTISFQLSSPIGTAYFEGEHNGDEISGDFNQAGNPATFYLKRSEGGDNAEAPLYQEDEVTFFNGPIRLTGTLTVPTGDGPFPAVVTISGSGPQNRDSDLFGFKAFAILADHFTRAGIAVLRYDDRGVGGSSGNISDATSEDFAGDVLSAVAFLRMDGRIRADRIGLVGHSEGGIVGPLAASISDDPAFVVMLAGPALSGAEILELQGQLILESEGADAEAKRRQLETQRTIFRAVRTNEGWDEVDSTVSRQIRAAVDALPASQRDVIPDAEALVRSRTEQQIASFRSRWFRHFIGYDPRPALSRITVPILAVFGSLDLQVPAGANASELTRIFEASGHPDHTIETIEGANHLFMAAITGSPSEYGRLEKAFAPGLLDLLTTWILDRTR